MTTLTACARAAALILVAAQGLLFAAPASAQDDQEDPPARAARLSALAGDVGFRAAQEQDWSDASLNRPLTNGDALDLSRGARAELDIGGGQVRLGGDTRAVVDRLDEQVARIHLEEGAANLRVEQVDRDPAFEIETPRFSFIPSRPGQYRIDVEADGHTTLAVYDGAGTLYGADGTRYELRENQSYEVSDAHLRDITGGPLPERDDFDRWVEARDERSDDRPARRYVAESVVGVDDLDDYGRWETVADYGAVWYPTVVVSDWAPYRYGHWVFVRPWGWTWIDDAPWGYAPFHYGRWVHRHGRWGWVPGPREVRPVYAPALVGFIGGPSLSISISSGPPVGWFPLGPREVYCPPYHVTRHYFTQVNVTNVTINHTVVNNVYEDVHVHRHGLDRVRYAYRGDANATTVASRDDFSRGRHIGDRRVRVDAARLGRATVSTTLDVPRQVEPGTRRGDGRRSDGHDGDREDDRRDRGWRGPGSARPASPSRPDSDPRREPAAPTRYGSFDRPATSEPGNATRDGGGTRLGAEDVRPQTRMPRQDSREGPDRTRQVWRTPRAGVAAEREFNRQPERPQYGQLQPGPAPREQPEVHGPDARRDPAPARSPQIYAPAPREPARQGEPRDRLQSYDRDARRESFAQPNYRSLPAPQVPRADSSQRLGRQPVQQPRAAPQPRDNPGPAAQGRYGRLGPSRDD